MVRWIVAVVLLAAQPLAVGAAGVTAQTSMGANPVRKVVNMLQMMQNKVRDEGERETALFEKFMCYCKNGQGSLQQSIDAAEDKVPQLESDITEAKSLVTQLVEELAQHQQDKTAAKAAMAEATSIRERDSAEFAKESSENAANIKAMGAAIAALEKGMGAGFLQTAAATTLTHIVQTSTSLTNSDQEAILSFLSQSDSDAESYAPASGEIVGILKQMKDTMESDLKDLIAQEEKAKTEYAAMMSAKKKEADAATAAIEAKTARLGDTKVEIVNLEEDLDDTSTCLQEDKAFIANLKKNCGTKQQEWTERQKTRTDELVAISETIKILNDDDALGLFKKTLPGPKLFLQVEVSTADIRREALKVLRASRHGRAPSMQMDLIALALRGKKVGFGKVITMVDNMVVLLGKEQKADDDKKAECRAEFDRSEDDGKALAQAISDLGTAIEEAKGAEKTLAEEISALAEGIKALDKEVAGATEQRKQENAEYVENLASHNAAKQLLEIAKNRLNKFYNAKLHKAAPKRELTEEQRITSNLGGTLAPTAAPGGIAGTGVMAALFQDPAALVQLSMRAGREAPPPPPETFGAYQKKGEESTGVIALVDLLKADLTKEVQEMEFNEKEAQADYEQLMKDSTAKRAADSKSIAEKEGARAGLEEELHKLKMETKNKKVEAMDLAKYVGNLHGECDWLIANADARKEARAAEVDSLQKAKAVLSGADYSLLQTGHSHLRRGR